jgi:hypothetical protein
LQQSRVSFKAFLQTGKLGPLSIGSLLKDVAAGLGPPRYWSNVHTDYPVPNFWGYHHLELRFSERTPSRLEHFQLSRADELRGRSVALCGNLRLSLNGLHGALKPSDFLRHDLWPNRKVIVDIQLIAGELQLRLGARPIELLYVMKDDVDNQAVVAFHNQDWHSLVDLFECGSRLYSIGCYSKNGWPHRHWKAPLIETDGQRYLDHAVEIADAGETGKGTWR